MLGILPGYANVYSIEAFLAFLQFENNLVVLLDLFFEPGYVHKYFLSIFLFDKTETFCFVKKFNCSFFHCFLIVTYYYYLLLH